MMISTKKRTFSIISVQLLFIVLFAQTSDVFAQAPVANFSSRTTIVCGNDTVTFYDKSTGTPTGYLWTIKNSGGATVFTSTLKNPVFNFVTVGTYTVVLNVTNPSGNNTKTANDYLTVFAKPTSAFTSSTLIGCIPYTASFTDQSTSGNSTIVKWDWKFGDLKTSTLQNPTNIYESTNKFDVSLIVTDANSCTAIEIKNDFITTEAKPKAIISGGVKTSCNIPFNVNFTQSSTGNNLTYFWDFGDGATSTQSNPAHTYTNFGNYNVKLKVTSGIGCADSITIINFVTINSFTVDFGLNNNASGCIPLVGVSFNDLSNFADSWNWNFGDAASGASNTSTLQNSVHDFNTAGSYNVTLIATRSGCKDTIIKSNFITVFPKPVVDFTANDVSGCSIPFNVSFSDLTTGGASYIWNFGDPATTLDTSSQKNPVYTYTSEGNFNISLIVTDLNGCVNSKVVNTFIMIKRPVAGITTNSASNGCIPLTVNFIDNSVSNETITKWSWDFGDDGSGNLDTSSVKNPAHLYQDTGSFNVRLIMENIDGCKDTATFLVETGIPPVPFFSVDTTIGCYKFKVKFKSEGLTSPYADSWFWDFDNGTSTDQNPSHLFTDTGFFDVKFLAKFHNCPSDTLTTLNLIRVLPPISNFNLSTPALCVFPDSVTVTDVSVEPEYWNWSFGDTISGVLDTSSAQFPAAHLYTKPGSYTITLITKNTTQYDNLIGVLPTGLHCADTVKKIISISNIEPLFSMSDTMGCEPLTVTFIDSTNISIPSRTQFPIFKWKWNFGDGDSVTNSFTGQTGLSNIPSGTNGGRTSGKFGAPIHVYVTSGNYTPRLILIDNNGCSDTIFGTTIRVNQLPGGDFSTMGGITKGCTPLQISFLDVSTGTAPMEKWEWELGTASDTSSLKDPVFNFNIPGIFTIKLTVTDTNGCKSPQIVKSSFIEATFPFPAFSTAPVSVVCSGVPTNFINSSTGIGTPLEYKWIFGNGDTINFTTAAISPKVFIVDTTTTYTNWLIVKDRNNCTDSISKQIIVSKPVANFSVVTTDMNCPPVDVLFKDSSSADVILWNWNFGDDLSTNLITAVDSSINNYKLAGNYDLTLIVTNQNQCTDTIVKPKLINLGGPQAKFDFFPKSGCAPLPVKFWTTDTNNVKDFFWDFGNGNTALLTSGDTVYYTFTNAGIFLPNLKITDFPDPLIPDDKICEVTIFGSSNVTISGPSVDFAISSDSICPGGTIGFTNLTTNLLGDETWLWDFGNSQSNTLKDPPALVYTNSGDMKISLSVYYGPTTPRCEASRIDTVNVFSPPMVQITISDDDGCVPHPVDFSIINSTITYPDSTWSWTFGDGNIGSGKTVSNTYNAVGTYSVTYTCIYKNGCSKTYDAPADIVLHESPIAGFTYSPNLEGLVVKSIAFTDSSTGVISHLWDFGDNTTSTEINPVHSYLSDGEFNISLIGTNQYGCTDTFEVSDQFLLTIFIPNIFTPNADGENDQFKIVVPGDLSDQFKLNVFNRWGQKVYENNSYKNDWAGTDLKNNPLLNGTYYYLLTFRDRTSWAGWVRLQR